MKKSTTYFTNIRINTYGVYNETLEEHDRRICDEDDMSYESSELTETIKEYTVNNTVKTDFNSLVKLAKELYDYWGYRLIIEPDGSLLIYYN